ncbi:hypothetical protein [Ligilactobacillus ceti]|uniref:YycH family protein n=1 Tax=Ligilactobacillus ceti DSM 22408 TaxID=1122146 RepID=A0A0R2KJ31_9LACO|nr:hypothetical protein [Ligilactobacillus ceti]KRN89345.1 YycH family protein [Ligilactobacillus ceti DSM 22408]
MKIRNVLLYLALVIAVLFSIVMSGFLWLNPIYIQRHYQIEKKNQKKNINNENIKKKSSNLVYSPTSLVDNKGNASYKLTSEKIDVLQNVLKSIKTWHMTDLAIENVSKKEYQSYLQIKNSLVLNYSAPVTLSWIKNLFVNDLVTVKKLPKIMHIVIPYESKKSEIYLLDENNLQLLKVHIEKQNLKALKKIIKDKNLQKNQITWQDIDGRCVMYYQNAVQVPNYSYLLEKQGADIYITRLLGANGSSLISSKEQRGKMVYYDGTDKRMIINNQLGMVSYINYDDERNYHDDKKVMEKNKINFTEMLELDLQKLITLGIGLDDLRYDEYNSHNHVIAYRSYINGLPIISDRLYGTYQLQTIKNGGLRLDFSLYTLQVPVPSQKNSTELVATKEVLKRLAQYGYTLDNITDIKMGYSWKPNAATKEVIDLEPTYFIYYNGIWLNCSEIVKVTTE